MCIESLHVNQFPIICDAAPIFMNKIQDNVLMLTMYLRDTHTIMVLLNSTALAMCALTASAIGPSRDEPVSSRHTSI